MACAYLAYESAIHLTTEGHQDAIIVGLPLSGHVTGSQHETQIVAGRGSAWIASPGHPLRIRMSSDFRMVSLIMNWNAVRQRLRNLSGGN